MAQVLRLRLRELLGTFLAPHLLACRGAVQVTIQSICIADCDFEVELCFLISMLLSSCTFPCREPVQAQFRAIAAAVAEAVGPHPPTTLRPLCLCLCLSLTMAGPEAQAHWMRA